MATIATATTAEAPSQVTASSSKSKRVVAPWKHFVAGGVGGMTGAIVTSPFDVVKTRLQSDLFKEVVKAGGLDKTSAAKVLPRRTGAGGLLWHFVETAQLIRRISVEEGTKALFKGLGPTLVGVVPARAINFSTYATTKSFLATQFPSAPTELVGETAEQSPVVQLGAAATAGLVTATATNPIWVVKTRLQLDARKRTPAVAVAPPLATATKAGMPPAFVMTLNILKKEGLPGLYRGLSASYLGVTEGVIQWVLYERLKKISSTQYEGQPARSKMAEWTGIIGASGGAKMVASLITYPHEVIRTRLRQPALNPGGPPKYTGLLQTLKLVIAEEGAASLYGGLSAHLMRVVPNAACMYTIYELAVRFA